MIQISIENPFELLIKLKVVKFSIIFYQMEIIYKIIIIIRNVPETNNAYNYKVCPRNIKYGFYSLNIDYKLQGYIKR